MWVCLVPPIAALFANGVFVCVRLRVCMCVCHYMSVYMSVYATLFTHGVCVCARARARVRECACGGGRRGGFQVRMRTDVGLLQDWTPYPVLHAAISRGWV